VCVRVCACVTIHTNPFNFPQNPSIMQSKPSRPRTLTWRNDKDASDHAGNSSLSVPNNAVIAPAINIGEAGIAPLLPMIFQHVAGSIREWGELRWVCKQWRDAAMNRPSLDCVAKLYVRGEHACAGLANLRRVLPVLDLTVVYNITEMGVRSLSTLPSLEKLDIRARFVNDQALYYLSTCTSLKSLRLSSSAVHFNRRGMRFLSTLPSLRELYLYNMRVSDEQMEALSSLSSLEVLTVHEPSFKRVSHKTIRSLSKLTSLRKLFLQWPSRVRYNISHPAGISPLSALTSLRELRLMNLCVTNADLETLSSLHFLEMLMVTEARDHRDLLTYDMGGMDVLSRLTSLKKLVLQWPILAEGIFADAGLHALSALTSLVTLELLEIKGVTDAGLQSLSALVSLQFLFVFGRHLCTDTGIEALSTLTSLRVLLLSGCPNVTDAGLLSLRSLVVLEKLTISSPQFTDAGMEAFKSLTRLESLDLSGCALITNTGIKNLYVLNRLEKLDLWGCIRVGDESIRELCKLPKLLELHVEETGLTEECSRQLFRSLPEDSNLKIIDSFILGSESEWEPDPWSESESESAPESD
jgi:hypothetical protein